MKYYIAQIRRISKNARLFLLSNILSSIGVGAFFVLFNLYLQMIGIDSKYIGAVNSAFALGIAFSAFFSGVISDSIGRKYSFIIGAAISAISFSLLVASKFPITLVIFAFVMGSANSLFLVSQNPFLLENSTSFERPHLFSLSMATFIFGEFIGGLLAGFLPHLLGKGIVGAERALYISSILVAVAILPLLFIKEEWDYSKPLELKASFKAPFIALKRYENKRQGVLVFILAQFLVGAGAGFVVPFSNLYFKNIFRLSTKFIGIIFSIESIMIVLGTLISPLIRNKFGKLRGVVITQSMSLPFVLILAFTKRVSFAIGSFLLRGMVMNAAVPVENQLYMEFVPSESRAALSSLMQIAWNLSWGIASGVAGFIMAKSNFSLMFMLMFIFYISSIIVLYYGLNRRINE